ncbi:MAG: hypothetical protein LBR00_02065, partial [Clostridiales Family XIII bacterium]|nr:hypothetical protein [Clostridiales Family XIII bacterium]
MTEKITVIDGNSLVFRAYYAMQNPMVTSKGVYTQAVFGFLNMLTKALDDRPPDYVAIAFDRKAPTFRHLEYPEYKAGRRKTPDELHMQIPYVKDILDAMGIAVLEADGFEADDLIGTVCKRAEEAGLEPLVITGDRDELQLVSERTSVLLTKKGVSEFSLFTPEAMREKYGFGPELFVDYKALMGDASDNIPGLPGVGEKTAAKLVQQFGTVENLLAHTDEVTPERIRGIVEENGQLAVMSKRLATIVTDAPVDVDFGAMRVRPWDVPRLREIYTELEFRMFLKRLDAQAAKYAGDAPPATNEGNVGAAFSRPQSLPSGSDPRDAAPTSVDADSVETVAIDAVGGLGALKNALSAADKDLPVVLKLFGGEDHVKPPVVYAIFILVNNTYFCVDVAGNGALLRETLAALKAADVRYSGWNLQGDWYKMHRFGAQAGRIADDVQIAHYLLAPSNGGATLAQIALTHAGLSVPEPPDMARNVTEKGQYTLLPENDMQTGGRQSLPSGFDSRDAAPTSSFVTNDEIVGAAFSRPPEKDNHSGDG